MTILAADRSRLGILVDPGHARDVFQRRLPGFAASGLQVEGCVILHTRYRTSTEDALAGKAFLSVCYRLEVHDPARARRGVQVLHLKAYPPGKSRQKFAHAGRACTVPPRFGEAVAHLPELDAVVWSFPNDPKLPHLPEVIDPQTVKRHLPYAGLPRGLQRAEKVGDVRVDVVRYKPEVRCTTRYELRGELPAPLQSLVVYGKTFAHRRGAEIARRMDSLWRQSQAGDGRQFRVARPLGYSETVRTVWQHGLPGTPLVRILDRLNYRRLLQIAAVGLARFHRARVAGLPSSTPQDDLDAVRTEVAEMAQAFPSHARDLGAVVSRLERTLSPLEAHPTGLVHGDFLLKQLVLHEGHLGLCDFDNLTMGDPIRDLANFLVDLHFHDFDASLVDDMAATFLGAYAAATAPLPAQRLQWQCRLHFLRGAYYFYKRRHGMPGFEEELARLLRRAQPPGFHA